MNSRREDPYNRRSVHEALKLWDAFEEMGEHPLAKSYVATAYRLARDLPDTSRGRGRALQYVFVDVLEDLKPEEGEPKYGSTTWRAYIIIHNRFRRSKTRGEIADDLGIALSTYDHGLARALDTFADILWEMNEGYKVSSQRKLRNIPTPSYSELMGREKELNKLIEALEDREKRWIISIDGLGGIGKTAVAIEAARIIAQTPLFRDIAWVSAKQEVFEADRITSMPMPVVSSEEFIDSVAMQLGIEISEMSMAEKAVTLKDFLKNGRYLIIIDNIETADDSEAIVDQFSGYVHPSKLLITTRYRLSKFSYPISLEGLEQDASISFIREEAERVNIQEIMSAEDKDLLAIYDATWGAPLAMKLLVAQLKKLPLSRVLTNLERIKGVASAQFYGFVFEQSWQLLSANAQHIFLAMPRFVPSGGIEAIMLASRMKEDDFYDAISELIDMSLVNTTGGLEGKRYSIHQLTRNFILAELLQRDTEGLAARRRSYEEVKRIHSHHYLDYAKRKAEDLNALEQERANILLGIDWAHAKKEWNMVVDYGLSIWNFLDTKGYYQNAMNCLTKAIASSKRVGRKADAATLSRALGNILMYRGDYDQGRVYLEESLVTAKQLGKPELVARLSITLGGMLGREGDYALCRTYFEQARELAQQIGDLEILSIALQNLGTLCLNQGNYDQATTYLDEALALAEQLGDQQGIAWASMNLGAVNEKLGDYVQSRVNFEQALEMAQQLDDKALLGWIWTNYGTIFERQGEYDQAQIYIERGLEIAKLLEYAELIVWAKTNLGVIATKRGEYARALNGLTEAHKIIERVEHKELFARNLMNLGALSLTLSEYERASAWFEQALEISRDLGFPEFEVEALNDLGEVLYSQSGDYMLAQTLLEEAKQIAQDIGFQEFIARTLVNLGNIAALQNDYRQSHSYLQEALGIARQIGHLEVVAVVLKSLGQLAQKQGQNDDARHLWEESLAIFKKLRHYEADAIQKLLLDS